jgi:hypothetical protein
MPLVGAQDLLYATTGARWWLDAAHQAKGTIRAKRVAPLFYCPNDKYIYIALVFLR